MPYPIRATVLLAALLPVASGRTLQDQPPPPTFRTEANYVRVDVYPTRDGAPVADLTQGDFELLDNGVPQRVEQFERVIVRAAGPQDARIEPNTVRESRAMLENSRSRVVVLFLDTYHVEIGGSHNIRKPLVEALDRAIGADDLVGVMTPDMAPTDIAFARKTTTIEGMLTRYWFWGERERLNPVDPVEDRYRVCYPGNGPTPVCPDDDRGVALEMTDRRHEKQTLDALSELVRHLRGVREERKAVLAITDGWLLYGPDARLARPLKCQIPGAPPVGFDPRTGKLAIIAGDQKTGPESDHDCDSDRIMLSQIDDERQFRELLDDANRSNTSFYPIDPRGLVVFDTPIVRSGTIGPPPPLTPPAVDAAMLRARLTSLRTLAEATDGLAIVDSNDIAGGLKRAVADLTSYYLLGYYASGKLDGKFHSITVRVKRPGVRVRARRGYLAASETDLIATARAGASPNAAANASAPAAAAEARAIEAALAPLDGFARPLPVRLYAAAGWKPGNTSAVWVAGELGPEWRTGAQGDIALVNGAGTTVATARATVDAGARAFRAALTPDQPLLAGDYIVRLRIRGADSTSSTGESLRIALPDPPDATGAIFMRRGAATGNKDVPTADLRFRRGEQLRVELPTPSSAAVSARLLDRTGKSLGVPVAASVRDDADGSRWQVAQLALAPLAAGDYLVELASEGKRSLLGFRVVP